MQKFCKKTLIFLMSGSVMFTLGGCGNKNASSEAVSSSEDTEKTSDTTDGADTTDTVKTATLDPKNPTTITVWNYYNGDQLAAFESLVAEFNTTIGMEKGIIVTSVSQGSIDNLADSLLASVEGKVGAADVPNMASVYADTAYILEGKDALVNLDEYFTADELAEYIPGFIEEGRMVNDGALVLFPVSKSTECFTVNTTDWAEFEAATGISPDSVNSLEKLTEVAGQYYEWSDSLTPDVPEDGKALYGRDSMSNYIFIGTKELGHEMFTVTKDGVKTDLDRDTFKTLWDNYYIPFINGYFASSASYRSEDMKTGTIITLTSSSSGISYLPTFVTDVNDVSHDISIEVYPQLSFEDAVSDVAVQQGAGYAILKTEDVQQYASTEFLKWFTAPEQNLTFSVQSGYSPVTLEANDAEKIKTQFTDTEGSSKIENIQNALLVSSDIFQNKEGYTYKPFSGSKDIRTIFDTALSGIATTDRAAVVEAIAAGSSREEAVAPYLTDEYFDAWFSSLCDQINALIG